MNAQRVMASPALDWVYRIAIGVLVGAILFAIQRVGTTLDSIDMRVRALELTVAGTYATRAEVKILLDRLEDRVNQDIAELRRLHNGNRPN